MFYNALNLKCLNSGIPSGFSILTNNKVIFTWML